MTGRFLEITSVQLKPGEQDPDVAPLDQPRQLIELARRGRRYQVRRLLPVDPGLPLFLANAYRDVMSTEASLRAMLGEMESLSRARRSFARQK